MKLKIIFIFPLISFSSSQFSFETGIPPMEFYKQTPEPVHRVLKGAKFPWGIPFPNPKMSIVLKDGNDVIGRAAAHNASLFWKRYKEYENREIDEKTAVWIALQKKAIAIEKAYLHQLGIAEEAAAHHAGLSVLPSYRGQGLGKRITAEMFRHLYQMGYRVLFCETGNRYSTALLEGEREVAIELARFSYRDLANELSYPLLATLDDEYAIWCIFLTDALIERVACLEHPQSRRDRLFQKEPVAEQ